MNLFSFLKGGSSKKTLVAIDWDSVQHVRGNLDFTQKYGKTATLWFFYKTVSQTDKWATIQQRQAVTPKQIPSYERDLRHYLVEEVLYAVLKHPTYAKVVFVAADQTYQSTVRFLQNKGIEATEEVVKGGGRSGRDRGDRPERGERPDRGERSPRGERGERPERGDRPERTPRGERPERAERSERPERSERAERPERGPRTERKHRSEVSAADIERLTAELAAMDPTSIDARIARKELEKLQQRLAQRSSNGGAESDGAEGDSAPREGRERREPREPRERTPLDPAQVAADTQALVDYFNANFVPGTNVDKDAVVGLCKNATGRNVHEVFRTRNARLLTQGLLRSGALEFLGEGQFAVKGTLTTAVIDSLFNRHQRPEGDEAGSSDSEPVTEAYEKAYAD